MNAGLKQGMRHQLRNRLSGSAPLSGFRNAKAFAVAGKKTEESSDVLPFKMEDLVNLCKKKGFIFQSSEIYSPMAGFYDYGPMGVELKNNIKKLWWRDVVQKREDIVGLDCSIISSPSIWQASGHVGGFSDPMVDCKESKLRFRADQVFWGALETEDGSAEAVYVTIMESDTMVADATKAAIKIAKKAGKTGPFKALMLRDLTEATADIYPLIPSPATGEPGHLTFPRDFNLMFQTSVGAISDESSVAYLRPETAQGIFTNFVNVQRTARMKVPFGIAQIGKAFRNEITPRNYIFRSREFEQMEIEYFISPEDEVWPGHMQNWIDFSWSWLLQMGLKEEYMFKDVHEKHKLAHYSKACTDITFKFPFGTSELMGIACRGNFDLTQHSNASGKTLDYFDPVTNEKYIPHVIEPSIGVDRLFLAVLTSAYREEKLPPAKEGGKEETRIVLGFTPSVAPIKAVVLPLVNNKQEISDIARGIYQKLQNRYMVEYDTSGAIGRRYRRADESGIPFCITVDYESLEDNCVTVRMRDSMEQKRMKIEDVFPLLSLEIDGI